MSVLSTMRIRNGVMAGLAAAGIVLATCGKEGLILGSGLLGGLYLALQSTWERIVEVPKYLLQKVKEYVNMLIDRFIKLAKDLGLNWLADLIDAGRRLLNAGFDSVDMALDALKQYGLYILGIYLAIRYFRR